MKKNATLIAGILFVAGCATSEGQRASYSSYDSPSRYDRADVSVSSTEHIERDSTQTAIPSSDVDTSIAVSENPAVGSYGGSVSGSVSGDNYDADSDEEFSINDSERDTDIQAEYSLHDHDDISADSSKRGGSLDARGYDQDANNDELEGRPEPINPGKQADSSVRGGSIFSREREWNHDAEPSSGQRNPKAHMKADSSIRGGSIEARGARKVQGFENQADSSRLHIQSGANWNPDDDLMLDGLDSESQFTTSFEFDNSSSVGGAASAEVGEGASSLDDEELDNSANGIKADLNSSEQLESNISGDIDLEKQDAAVESSGTAPDLQSSTDPNASDALSSSSSSVSTTDIHHDESDLIAESEEEMEPEAAGAAASSEVGASSSSDEKFESNDPALNKAGSPLGTSGNEPNFLYQDNRAQGVGSAATGEFANSPVNQGVDLQMTDDQLARQVKETLTSETTGTYGLVRSQVAQNVQVSADEGKITLTGTVPSEKDKDMIEVRVREIAGVREVENKLTVTPELDSSDREILRGSDLEDVTSGLQNE